MYIVTGLGPVMCLKINLFLYQEGFLLQPIYFGQPIDELSVIINYIVDFQCIENSRFKRKK